MRRVDGHLHLIIASKRWLQARLSHALSSQAHVHPLLGLALVDRRHVTDFLDRTPEFDASEYGDCLRRSEKDKTRARGGRIMPARVYAGKMVVINVGAARSSLGLAVEWSA